MSLSGLREGKNGSGDGDVHLFSCRVCEMWNGLLDQVVGAWSMKCVQEK